MSVDHIISRICNSRIGKVILIVDSTTLLKYEHQFMGVCMQWIVSHGFELHFAIIYMEYWSVVDSLNGILN